MKKVSLMLGTLGGAVAGYLFSNTKLRNELAAAKNAEEAGKIFAKHVSADSKKIGAQVKDFVESDAVQDNLSKAKTYAQEQFSKAKKELEVLVKKGKKEGKKMVADMTTKKKKTTAAKKKA